MREIMRPYLYRLADEFAQGLSVSIADDRQTTSLLAEKPEEGRQVLAEIIRAIADDLDTPDIDNLLRLAEKCLLIREEDGFPIYFLLERNRFIRQFVLENSRNTICPCLASKEEWQAYCDFQSNLVKMMDDFDTELISRYLKQEKKSLATEAIHLSQKEVRLIEIAEQELVQIVLQSNDIAVLVIDRELHIREANQALAQLLQVNRESIIGGHIDEMFRPRDEQRYAQWVIERGQAGHFVGEMNGKWTTISTSPIYRQGELWGAVAVIRYLTENRKLEEELSRREALAAVGQLAAGMAHEIRNPLTSIKGFVQLLREQFASERSNAYCSLILSEIERIDGLINDVLVLARYRDDKMMLEPFIVAEELFGVCRLVEPEATRRGIRIEMFIPENEWMILGYRARMKQAFLNIIKNALEALEQKGNCIRVTMFATISQVVIMVEDNGPGLSEQVHNHLFVPFYTTKQEGTGLGLTTTRRIVEDHEGELFADNSPGLGGARFEIRLPLHLS